MKIIHYVTILRPANAIMAGGAVCLGAWISAAPLRIPAICLLAIVAFLATGFGNVINDILDRETDRISHPDRPLPSGTLSLRGAVLYIVVLGGLSLSIAFRVAPRYGFATLLPLAALVIYALFLKGTPLAGNLLVSLLVAYSLLFGSLDAPDLYHLLLPAFCAMLLNFSREIIKDIEDTEGDRAAGIVTTAVLSPVLLKKLLFSCSVLYLLTVFVPFFIGQFGMPYVIVVAAAALPLHFFRLSFILNNNWTIHCARISQLLKIEMLIGLAALAVDRLTGILAT